MAEPRIWTELLTYGLGVALSPIHIVLLLLLLLGGSPLRRGGLFVGGWMTAQPPPGAAPWIVSPRCRFPCCC